MTRRPLDPRICPVAIDANALDRDGSERDVLVDRLLALSSTRTIRLLVPKRVRAEIQNPQTPAHVKEAALPQIFTIGVGLNSDEKRRKRIITAELQGNAKLGKHEADPFNCYSCTVWAIEYSKSWGLPAGIYWWSHRRCISAGGFRRHSSRDPDAPRVVRQQGRAEKRNAFRLLSIAAVHDLPKIGANRRTCAAQPELLYARPRRFAWTTRLM